jgi:hypothetical protein
MKLTNPFAFFKKREIKESRKKEGSFSDFFLNASEADKKEVITRAAKQANEEQRRTFLESSVSAKR